ncbi:Acg family FMN-binding oxidoreductase [Haloechinothrix sp. LS1_15]|uniref:Acg family FMN-binding oxidoreductase n=1 Tax=Haloechinothrix sp. LS1_15 TaxID=2652248 RepID=UPI0029454DD6|nr:nitroreductase [Haloechinothrix sp. LS1_15]MDV6014253.1 nitroreductase [Haloechinothrix sp. LS1_15]
MTAWTPSELRALELALGAAPSVQDTMPWVVESHPDRVDLFEWTDRPLAHHDPTGRDRLISCGAALTNLRVAARSLGRITEVELFPEADRPALVARVTPSGEKSATARESALHRAVHRRRTYRHPFSGQVVAGELAADLAAAGHSEDVGVHRVMATDLTPLAEVLTYAATALRGDRGLQRELAMWMGTHASSSTEGKAPPFAPPADNTLPWMGLVRSSTRIPDSHVLASRLAEELLLVVHTGTDTAPDHVRAGAALQRIWLSAVDAGLVGNVITQPLHLTDVRTRLGERLGIAGFPQVMVRIGYPADEVTDAPKDLRGYLRRTEAKGTLR